MNLSIEISSKPFQGYSHTPVNLYSENIECKCEHYENTGKDIEYILSCYRSKNMLVTEFIMYNHFPSDEKTIHAGMRRAVRDMVKKPQKCISLQRIGRSLLCIAIHL